MKLTKTQKKTLINWWLGFAQSKPKTLSKSKRDAYLKELPINLAQLYLSSPNVKELPKSFNQQEITLEHYQLVAMGFCERLIKGMQEGFKTPMEFDAYFTTSVRNEKGNFKVVSEMSLNPPNLPFLLAGLVDDLMSSKFVLCEGCGSLYFRTMAVKRFCSLPCKSKINGKKS